MADRHYEGGIGRRGRGRGSRDRGGSCRRDGGYIVYRGGFGGRGGHVTERSEHVESDDDVDDESDHYTIRGHRRARGNRRQNFRFNRGGRDRGRRRGRGRGIVDDEGQHEYNRPRTIRSTRFLEPPSSASWEEEDEQNDGFDERLGRRSKQVYRNSRGYRGQHYVDHRRDKGGCVDTERQTGQGQAGESRRMRSLKLTVPFLRDLEEREPADIIMTLSHIDTDLNGALKKCANDDQMLTLLISVLASAFTCNSMPEQLITVLTVIKNGNFLYTASDFCRNMLSEKSPMKQKSFRKSLMDMITIMSEMYQKNPTAVTDIQTLGLHTVLQTVISDLKKDTSVIDKHVVQTFKELTEHKDILLKSNIRIKQIKVVKDKEDDIIEEAPPGDFREIEIFPQRTDMKENEIYLRKNKVKGKYENLDHYLDVQFRLLREDFIGPLREGVCEYIHTIKQKDKDKHNQDVRIYTGVQLVSPVCGDEGIHHQIQFDVSRLRSICWKSTKRLIYGSLVCLSPDNFKTFYFATVVDRKPELLESGLITVHFEHSHQEINYLYGTEFTMAETTAYFESYRHVLNGLQRFQQGDLPFEKYIISCKNEVEAPAYIRRQHRPTFDLRSLVDEDIVLQGDNKLKSFRGITLRPKQSTLQFSGKSAPAAAVEILNKKSWPSAEMLHLDESQYKAIRTALTKEFVITQGPPGTGKTYIGLKIVKTLLHNKHNWCVNPNTGQEDPRPMLIVCYTNHALDQFLEGIVKFYKDNVIRVGSRSSSEILKHFNIQKVRQTFRQMRKIPASIYKSKKAAMDEMDSIYFEITRICVTIQIATSNVLHEDYLQPFMGLHYQMLIHQFKRMVNKNHGISELTNSPGFSFIVEWLELANLASMEDLEFNLTADNNDNYDLTEEMIDVEDDVHLIQKQRKLDEDYDDYLPLEGFEEDCTLTRRQKKDQFVSREKKHGSKANKLVKCHKE